MQSGMSMHDSIALMVMHLPGISSSPFVSWLCLDSQPMMNSYGPGLYSILMLFWSICSSILWSLCDRLPTSFLNIATNGLWSVVISGYHLDKERYLGAPEITFTLTLGFLNSISASPFLGLCCGPYHQHPTLQQECHLLCQIWFAGLWRFISLSKVSPAGDTPKGSLVSLYLPNWHAIVVKYEDFLSCFRLRWPELASIIDM